MAAALAQSVKADTAIIDGEVVGARRQGQSQFPRLAKHDGFGTKPAVKAWPRRS